MFELLQMWALVEILGFICLPLTMTVFHNLPDRGWAFTKAIGMALLAFFVWLPLMYFQILPFSQLFILGVLLLLLAGNIVGFIRVRQTILKVIRANFSYIVACEVVFIGMIFLLGWIRSYGPDIRSFEMYMDEGFIAAIMRSTHFPPSDMWFSGYSINYYYYAHFNIAVLAKLLGQTPSIAFNTGISLFFGLTAVNLFGVTCNIVAWARHIRARGEVVRNHAAEAPDTVFPSLLRAIPYGILTMVMGLLLGNLASTQQWWKNHGDALAGPYDWFAPSRVIDKTINEFPAFSFLLSCFHAHVLALAFTILGIGLAFNLLLSQDGRGLRLFGRGVRLPFTLFTTALILGGLFTMNGWDFPTYLGLAIVCIILQQWLAHRSHFSFDLVLNIITTSIALIVVSFVLFVPFYFNFVSPSQGIGVVGPVDRSQLKDEILIYGTFAFLFISLLLANVLKGMFSQNLTPQTSEAPSPVYRRWRNWVALYIVLVVLAIIAIAYVMKNSTTFIVAGSIALVGFTLTLSRLRDRSQSFVLLLGTVAFTLVAVCEVFYLRDVFAGNFPRMNTVFKFYFQSWALLSVTSGAGLYFMVENFRPSLTTPLRQRWSQRSFQVVWTAFFLLLLVAGTAYPVAGADSRTNHYIQRSNSLDGLDYLQNIDPGDYAAIHWLNSNIKGDPVIIESIGNDWSDSARISAFTGLPTPMGWVGHEYQWRANWLNTTINAQEFGRRGADIDTIYTDPDPNTVLSLLAHYLAQYLYVGSLEQAKYPTVDLHRFSSFMRVVYSAYGVTIYQVE